jgi:hypothetical protein
LRTASTGLADCADHELGLLLVYLVAAMGVGDVFRILHKRGEPRLRLFLRGIGDVAKFRRHVGRQCAGRNHCRDLWSPAPVRRQYDQGNLTQRRSGAELVKAAIDIDRFKGWVLCHPFTDVSLDQLALYSPLLRRLGILKPFAENINEHETSYLVRIGTRIESADQTAVRMGHKHVRPRFAGGTQQSMQIGDTTRRRGRLRNRVAPARLLTDRRSRTVVSTDPGELGDLGKHPRTRLLGDIPIIGGPPEASHQHDGRGPRAATFQIHFAPAADVDQVGKIVGYRSIGGR